MEFSPDLSSWTTHYSSTPPPSFALAYRDKSQKGVTGVRWCPFGSWGGHYGCCFKVLYIDFKGLVHIARCWTGGFRRGVLWTTDEVIREKTPEDAA